MPEVLLEIDGRTYGGWKTVEIVRSIETIAGAYTLGVTERWPGQQAVAAIAPGNGGRLRGDGETIITGPVDEVAPEYGAENHQGPRAGWDATGALADAPIRRQR